MEQREIILRQQLGKHSYKLKGANERFFVKCTYTDKVASPLDDWCKNVVFDTLNRFRTKGSKWLINEDRTFIESEVFNLKSELYAFTEYNVSNILDELHIHKFYNMPILEEIRIAFSEIYYKKYEELNADILEKEVDDGEFILQDLVGDGELTENDLLEIAFNDIGVDGLKKFILE